MNLNLEILLSAHEVVVAVLFIAVFWFAHRLTQRIQ